MKSIKPKNLPVKSLTKLSRDISYMNEIFKTGHVLSNTLYVIAYLITLIISPITKSYRDIVTYTDTKKEDIFFYTFCFLLVIGQYYLREIR